MSRILLTVALLPGLLPALAQVSVVPAINRDLLSSRWKARWIAPPGVSLRDYGVFHFHRSIDRATMLRSTFVWNGKTIPLRAGNNPINHS